MTKNIRTKKIPSIGPTNAKVMIVGEAGGEDEEWDGEPFTGVSGQFLHRYLDRVGFSRDEIFLTNLSKYRPNWNNFRLLLGTTELQDGLAELSAEIEEVNPDVIVACGAWPMYYLTGCTGSKGRASTGVFNWRGSVVQGSPEHIPTAGTHKVLITLHPAFIVRPAGFGWHPVFYNDLRQLNREVGSPLLNYPTYTEYIDPPNTEELVREMCDSEWLTVDIETFGDSLACVGMTDSVGRGLCITCDHPEGWQWAQWAMLNKVKKNLQYGAFDINYLKWFYNWEVVNYKFDTYIAGANLMPEFPRSLAFYNSMYTPFPFYKEDRKKHKRTGDLLDLWKYNLRDVVVQHWIAMDQMKELSNLYKGMG